jgi:Flp pilus assembly protein TadD
MSSSQLLNGQEGYGDNLCRVQAGDFARALRLTDLALRPHPNDPVLHEFRALCLFALGRYDKAAAALYAVLTADLAGTGRR